MRVHHLNCATLCPVSARLVNGAGSLLGRGLMVCHCLLVETPKDGLLLVDTGFGLGDVRAPKHLGAPFRLLTSPQLREEETALRQLEARGYTARDVRHIVLTHLDLDHAGGLPDFPEAEVHVSRAEHDAALAPRTFNERNRYKAAHFAHGPRWVPHDVAGERWHGFEAVRAIDREAGILLVPLAGHTRGHAAIAVQSDDGWLLHVGDAMFSQGELQDPPRCPAGLRHFQSLMAVDDAQRRANQARVRALAAGHPELRIVCAHDPAGLASASADRRAVA